MRSGGRWQARAGRALAGLLGVAVLWASALAGSAADMPQPRRDVTFLSTSDSHYREAERKAQNERNRITILEMNKVAGLAWPENLGGETVRDIRDFFAEAGET